MDFINLRHHPEHGNFGACYRLGRFWGTEPIGRGLGDCLEGIAALVQESTPEPGSGIEVKSVSDRIDSNLGFRPLEEEEELTSLVDALNEGEDRFTAGPVGLIIL